MANHKPAENPALERSEGKIMAPTHTSAGLPDKRPASEPRRSPLLRRRPNPSIAVTLIISLGMLAYVAYLAAARESAESVLTIFQRTWIAVVILIFPYLAARLLVWYELLCQLDIAVPRRQLAVAFAAGEVTKALPAGVYLQNVVLGRLSHLGPHSLVRSTTATTAMLGLESAIAVPLAVIVGVPGQPWLRATILGIVAAWIVVLILARLFVHGYARRLGGSSAGWWQRLILIIDEFLTAGSELLSRRTVRSIVPTGIYMLIYAIILFAIIRAAGAQQITFVDALGIYAVLVLAVIMVPIPTEIGITEFTGLGTLLAYGLPESTAAIVMVSFRILTTGATLLVGGVLLAILRHEFVTTADSR